MAKVIVIANQKGGVGKTTTTVNLADALVEQEKKVLVIDFDSSANLSSCFGVDKPEEIEMDIAQVMLGIMEDDSIPEPEDYIQHWNGVDFISSSSKLSLIEAKLLMEAGSDKILAELVDSLRDLYDFILIDTNPSLGSLTTNALAASDQVLITLSPQYFSLTGLVGLMNTIKKVHNRINDRLSISGICMTICDFRTNLYKEVKEQLVDFCGDKVKIFKSEIPSTVRVGESLMYGTSVRKYMQSSPAGDAYYNLAKELIEL